MFSLIIIPNKQGFVNELLCFHDITEAIYRGAITLISRPVTQPVLQSIARFSDTQNMLLAGPAK